MAIGRDTAMRPLIDDPAARPADRKQPLDAGLAAVGHFIRREGVGRLAQ